MEIEELLVREERTNSYLQSLLSGQDLPSGEQARELDTAELYKLASTSIEFKVKRDLELIASNN